jgi:hypothetical protein
MPSLVGLFFAKLIALPVFIPALVVGFLSRRWWHVIVGTFALALIVQVALANLDLGNVRVPNLPEFFVGFLAALVWSSGTYYFRVARPRKLKEQEGKQGETKNRKVPQSGS